MREHSLVGSEKAVSYRLAIIVARVQYERRQFVRKDGDGLGKMVHNGIEKGIFHC